MKNNDKLYQPLSYMIMDDLKVLIDKHKERGEFICYSLDRSEIKVIENNVFIRRNIIKNMAIGMLGILNKDTQCSSIGELQRAIFQALDDSNINDWLPSNITSYNEPKTMKVYLSITGKIGLTLILSVIGAIKLQGDRHRKYFNVFDKISVEELTNLLFI